MTTSYERYKTKEVAVAEIAQWRFAEILKTVKRRITFKEKFNNPWTITVTEQIHRSIFVAVYQAIRDHVVHHKLSFFVKRKSSWER